MSKFDTYFLMKEEDVITYLKEKTSLFTLDSECSCEEIGDGNLNYVFRVVEEKTSKSVIVKQAGETARISDEFKLSTNRIRIESSALELQGKFAPGLVPEVFVYDNVMNCCVMEDLSDHEILRTALIHHKTFPQLAEDITTFMVQSLLLTTDVVMEHKEKKDSVGRYLNPELCEVTEDLVYTEPYNDCNNRNAVFPPNLEWVRREIYEEQALRLEVAKLKFDFMTKAQALLHGDLHTGSIFVKKDSTKVIDPEFAFYGPIGYDVGNVVANLIFAWANAKVTVADRAFTKWVEETIVDVINLFKQKFHKTWEDNVQDIMAKEKGFKEWYLESVLEDTAAVVGLELIRRIVGLAQVKDITSIEDESSRVRAERMCLSAAKQFIMKRTEFTTGEDFLQAVKEFEQVSI
ncbi:S-methyl-5-thioribose kinase [Bacillus tianshenii]|nr:S-methyl-5-thioribose kinase [Bacillus tianshenii]